MFWKHKAEHLDQCRVLVRAGLPSRWPMRRHGLKQVETQAGYKLAPDDWV